MSLLRIVDYEGNAILEITLSINREYKDRSIEHWLNQNLEMEEMRDVTKFYNNDVILKQILIIYYFNEDERCKEEV